MRSRPDAASPGEFELIARLCAKLPRSRRTILGPGDDCAIIARGNAPILATVDSMVENVHFNLAWLTPEQLGARSLTVNLSDVAAMGGVATSCVVNLAVRPGLTARFFDRLYAGLRRAARAAAVDVVGGNVTRARELAITIALLGDAPQHPLRRDAARAGDEIFVTGTVGDAALGWRTLARKLAASGASRRHLISRYLAPSARLFAGQHLAKIRPAPAAIDVSDGLLQDLGHVLERSGVGAEIDAASVPVSKAYEQVMGSDLSLALGGGEDYELIFCLRPGRSEKELARLLKVPVRRIGRIVGRRGLHLAGGMKPPFAGWDQLRG
ncbi:MAG: thiamine-phosphate kinase [Candidatus Binataceae bacterium]